MENKRKSSKGNGLLWLRLGGSFGGAMVKKRGALPRKEAFIS